jgi:hypothetical protein
MDSQESLGNIEQHDLYVPPLFNNNDKDYFFDLNEAEL